MLHEITDQAQRLKNEGGINTVMPAIIFDTETTGLKSPRIVEAAYIETDVTEDGQLLHGMPFVQRYNPGIPSELGALKVHNILDSELIDQPPHTDFSVPDHIQYIICQNSKFDMQMVPNPEKYKVICTVGMSRRLWPEADSHSLVPMIYHIFGRTAEVREAIKTTHSALADCTMTWHLLQAIIEKAQIGSLEQLYSYSDQSTASTTRIPFGKHKGRYMIDVLKTHPEYLEWLVSAPDMDKDLKTVAVKLLKERSL